MGTIERSISNEAEDYFGGAGRSELLKYAIQFAVSPKQSAIVFYGPAGIGKSVLLTRLYRHLSAYRHVSLVSAFFKTRLDFYRALCSAEGIDVKWNHSASDLRTALRSNFIQRDKPTLLLIDDAHEASVETLAHIIGFVSSFEHVKAVLAVDTFGSQVLREDIRKLRIPAMSIRPIARLAIKPYLSFQMPKVTFSPEQVSEIYRLSEGVPERINAAACYTAAGRTPKNFDPQAHLEADGLLRRIVPDALLNRVVNRRWSPGVTAGVGTSAIAIAASVAIANSALVMKDQAISVNPAAEPVELHGRLAQSQYSRSGMGKRSQPGVVEIDASTSAKHAATKWLDFSDQIPERIVPNEIASVTTANGTAIRAAEERVQLPLQEGDRATDSTQLSAQETALLAESGSGFVLQFMTGDSFADMQRFVVRYKPMRLRLYRTVVEGSIIFKAISPSFAERKEALRQVEELPPQLRKNPPWVRRVSGVQNELLKFSKESSIASLRLSSSN